MSAFLVALLYACRSDWRKGNIPKTPGFNQVSPGGLYTCIQAVIVLPLSCSDVKHLTDGIAPPELAALSINYLHDLGSGSDFGITLQLRYITEEIENAETKSTNLRSLKAG